MKRDMDLVRKFLIVVEDAKEPLRFGDFRDSPGAKGFSEDEILYHLRLMQAHGLLDAVIEESDDGMCVACLVYGLTWDGQDFLDALRDDSVWEKTKRAVRESVGSTTFEVVKCVAVEASKRMALGALAGMF